MFYGPWESLEELGSGGQGKVFRTCKKIDALARPELPKDFCQWLQACFGVKSEFKEENAKKIFDLMREFCREPNAQRYALKVLHEFKDDQTRAKAIQRLEREVVALQTFKHQALIGVIDHRVKDGWFVMDFHPTTLAKNLDRTQGDVLASLLAFRPIVEAVSLLHRGGIVHRDIKPDNVFITNENRLVLGDFGLAIQMDGQSNRLTDTYENVGSRDWMPGWAMGMKLENVSPAFDVFSLGKLLWAMVSGREKLRLWYLHDPEFELEAIFPDDPSVKLVRKILDRCIVEREEQCFRDAGELLTRIDIVMRAERLFGQLPDQGPIRCRICGFGEYKETIRDDLDLMSLACNYCGNTQGFAKRFRRVDWAKDPT